MGCGVELRHLRHAYKGTARTRYQTRSYDGPVISSSARLLVLTPDTMSGPASTSPGSRSAQSVDIRITLVGA